MQTFIDCKQKHSTLIPDGEKSAELHRVCDHSCSPPGVPALATFSSRTLTRPSTTRLCTTPSRPSGTSWVARSPRTPQGTPRGTGSCILRQRRPPFRPLTKSTECFSITRRCVSIWSYWYHMACYKLRVVLFIPKHFFGKRMQNYSTSGYVFWSIPLIHWSICAWFDI